MSNSIEGIIVKDLKYPNEESASVRENTGEVSVLSPTDNSKQIVPQYFAKWARGSETAGSVDENNTYVEDTATFTKATADDVTITSQGYRFDVVGASGTLYSNNQYGLTVGANNTITIRFEFTTAQGRPAFIEDILSGVIYAIVKAASEVEPA